MRGSRCRHARNLKESRAHGMACQMHLQHASCMVEVAHSWSRCAKWPFVKAISNLIAHIYVHATGKMYSHKAMD
jgi:hypothetical protein